MPSEAEYRDDRRRSSRVVHSTRAAVLVACLIALVLLPNGRRSIDTATFPNSGTSDDHLPFGHPQAIFVVGENSTQQRMKYLDQNLKNARENLERLTRERYLLEK